MFGSEAARTSGRLVVDTRAKIVTCNGVEVRLTATEYAILDLLTRHPGWVFSADEITYSVWGHQHYTTSVSVHIAHIRNKLNAACPGEYIETVRGLGYRLKAPDRQDRDETIGLPPATVRPAPLERDRFFRRLAELLDRSAKPAMTLALVSGVEGIGKTHCLHKAQQLAIQSDWLPMWFDCRLASENNTETWDFVASTLRAEGIGRAQDSPARNPDPSVTQHTVSEYHRHHETLASIATERPVLLLFDDADYMDDHTVSILAHVASDCSQQSFGIVVAARDRQWRLQRHFSEHAQGHFELRPLSNRETRELLQEKGIDWLTEHEIEVVTRVTSGIPRRLVDLSCELRHMHPGEAITEGSLTRLALTPQMRSRLADHIDSLHPAHGELLRWIAALDNDIDVRTLDMLAGTQHSEAWQHLQNALECGDIALSHDGERVTIPDHLLARFIHGGMSPTERTRRRASLARLPMSRRTKS